jgi:hypothetical protein
MLTSRKRPRLSYANVVSTLALFLALGGASYAATALAPGSVGTKQLRNGAVTPPKLAFGYQSGGLGRSNNREIKIRYSPSRCGTDCPPPFDDRRIAETTVRLTRPARLLITATNVVINNLSQPEIVDLYNVLTGAPANEEACFTQSVILANSAATVSCTGTTSTVRAGTYRLDVYESAFGTRSVRASANASQTALEWSTLPPGTNPSRPPTPAIISIP